MDSKIGKILKKYIPEIEKMAAAEREIYDLVFAEFN